MTDKREKGTKRQGSDKGQETKRGSEWTKHFMQRFMRKG